MTACSPAGGGGGGKLQSELFVSDPLGLGGIVEGRVPVQDPIPGARWRSVEVGCVAVPLSTATSRHIMQKESVSKRLCLKL